MDGMMFRGIVWAFAIELLAVGPRDAPAGARELAVLEIADRVGRVSMVLLEELPELLRCPHLNLRQANFCPSHFSIHHRL